MPRDYLGVLERRIRALVRLLPYAAAIGVLASSVAVFVLLQRQIASDLWSSAIGFVETKWRRGLLVPGVIALLGTVLLLVMEPFFLSWEKTTVFIVFVRRNVSAMVDLGSTIFFFSPFKTVVEYFFTFGVAFAIAKLTDAASARFDWVRWELPSEGVLADHRRLCDLLPAFVVHRLLAASADALALVLAIASLSSCGHRVQYPHDLPRQSGRGDHGYAGRAAASFS